MKPDVLTLEFAPRARRLPASRMLYLLLAVGFFALASFEVGKARYEQAQAQQQLAALEEVRAKPTARSVTRAKSDPTENTQAQLVRQASHRLNTPWADLLAALESAPTNAALLLVEPAAAKRTVSLTVETADSAGMLGYLKALQGDVRFSEVVLVSHQVQQQVPGTPLRFQLRAQWGEAP